MIVQSDFTVFLETGDHLYQEKRDFLASIAHLERSPEYLHTYKITALSLWTAAAIQLDLEWILQNLQNYSRYAVPQNVMHFIQEYYAKYGRIKIHDYDDIHYLLVVMSEDRPLLKGYKKLLPFLEVELEEGFLIRRMNRGTVKLLLMQMDNPLPVEDLASFKDGISLELPAPSDLWEPRDYQKEAVEIFKKTGHGIIVLPCGAGKTIVGLSALMQTNMHTLIVVPHHASLVQWKRELMAKLNIPASMIGEYSGSLKELRPITLATYQILVYSSHKGVYKHLKVFLEASWGLIIYDEVHMLPAPVFKVTTEIQAVRRLGLTATLVREDGKEKELFALIGPKRFDIPWKDLEMRKYIAHGICIECRVQLRGSLKMEYYNSTRRNRPRIAADNPMKDDVVGELLEKHKGEKILVIGQYIQQLERIAHRFGLPLITGKVPHTFRERSYQDFQMGKVDILVLSKVANLALDLPDAAVAIQVSGSYGSRQEEAQRLGRILRPKDSPAHFYSIVSRDTVDEEFSRYRQLFLVEQGYQYSVENWD